MPEPAPILKSIVVEIADESVPDTRSPLPWPKLKGIIVETVADPIEAGGNTSASIRLGNRLAEHGIRL